jgi:hypothetical protein
LKVCRNNQLLEAICVETPILLPSQTGEVRVVADSGAYCLFDEDGQFIKIVSAEKFVDYTVVG